MHPIVMRVRKLVRKSGFDLTRYPGPWTPPEYTYAWRMRQLGVTVVVDVGANEGQFGEQIRRAGWEGPILSYEPLSSAFEALRQRAEADATWRVFNVALGAAPATAQIHIAGNSMSSSFLPMLESHRRAAPESEYVGDETVEVTTLDEALVTEVSSRDRLCVKVDCQGYEREVLKGATATLRQSAMVVMELSFVQVYEGGMLFDEAVETMRASGFVLASLDPMFSDPETSELLQADGCFVTVPGRVGEAALRTMI